MSGKLWGGRFQSNPASNEEDEKLADKYKDMMSQLNSSLPIDHRLYAEDIRGSIEYARSLEQRQLTSPDELQIIQDGLDNVLREWKEHGWPLESPANRYDEEDIHSINERRLSQLIGAHIAGKLHTGRSRNDQVVTDMRLWLHEAVKKLTDSGRSELVSELVKASERYIDLIMPGYTHLQRAQPVRYSHFLLSHCFEVVSCLRRFEALLLDSRCDGQHCPLGSGALAGHPFSIDRHDLAQRLGFAAGPSWNSMQSVSTRSFVLDFLYACSMLALALSRFAEDLIIYSSSEFGMIQLSNMFSTGSSLMPQKKNPDSLELIRGKAGHLCGHLSAFMMTYKGLPSTYNKDLQDDKQYMFDSFDTLMLLVKIMGGVVATMKPDGDRMKQNLSVDMLATDLADEMVRLGVPFREAHHKSGRLIAICEQKSKESQTLVQLNDLSLDEMRSVFPGFTEAVNHADWWSFEASVERRNAFGGTSRQRVIEQIEHLRSDTRRI